MSVDCRLIFNFQYFFNRNFKS